MDDFFLLVGAPYCSLENSNKTTGCAYIYSRDGENGSWSYSYALFSPVDAEFAIFAYSLSLAGDSFAVGAPGLSSIFIYDKSSTIPPPLRASFDGSSPYSGAIPFMGGSLSFGGEFLVSGSGPLLGSSSDSAVEVFRYSSPTTWDSVQRMEGSTWGAYDTFGFSVAVFATHLAVGSPGENSVLCFSWNLATEEMELQSVLNGDTDARAFGHALDLWEDLLVVGDPDSDRTQTGAGAASSYRRDAFLNEWTLFAEVPHIGANLGGYGSGVCVRGSHLAVAGNSYIAVSLFQLAGSSWTRFLRHIDDDFVQPQMIALSENYFAVASQFDFVEPLKSGKFSEFVDVVAASYTVGSASDPEGDLLARYSPLNPQRPAVLGSTMVASGNLMAVGAPGDSDYGAVFVYSTLTSSLILEQTISYYNASEDFFLDCGPPFAPINCSNLENMQFGRALAMGGASSAAPAVAWTLAVSAPFYGDDYGRVFLYEFLDDASLRSDDSVILEGVQQVRLSQFGTAIALDGDTLAVAEIVSDKVYVYERTAPATWVLQDTLTFNFIVNRQVALALDEDAGTLVVGMEFGGVSVFKAVVGGNWTLGATWNSSLLSGGSAAAFGSTLALSYPVLAIGDPGCDAEAGAVLFLHHSSSPAPLGTWSIGPKLPAAAAGAGTGARFASALTVAGSELLAVGLAGADEVALFRPGPGAFRSFEQFEGSVPLNDQYLARNLALRGNGQRLFGGSPLASSGLRGTGVLEVFDVQCLGPGGGVGTCSSLNCTAPDYYSSGSTCDFCPMLLETPRRCGTCPKGFYAPGYFECVDCPGEVRNGTYCDECAFPTTKVLQDLCSTCIGEWISSTECRACAAGAYSPSPFGACVNCSGIVDPPGQACQPCGPSEYSPSFGSCANCHGELNNISSCEPCPAGFFSASPSSCLYCAGSVVFGAGGVQDPQQCQCPAGFFPPSPGECRECLNGSVVSELCVCPDGYFSASPGNCSRVVAPGAAAPGGGDGGGGGGLGAAGIGGVAGGIALALLVLLLAAALVCCCLVAFGCLLLTLLAVLAVVLVLALAMSGGSGGVALVALKKRANGGEAGDVGDLAEGLPRGAEDRGTGVCMIEWDDVEFDLNRPLGEGAFGAVYAGVLREEWEVAIKKLKIDIEDEASLHSFYDECIFLQDIDDHRHPNLPQYAGVMRSEDGDDFFMVMQLAGGGSLDHYLLQNHPLPAPVCLRLALDAAKGLAHLHSLNVVHNDIAARNFLLTEDLTVLVADLGLARDASGGQLPAETKVPVRWVAPETLQNMQYSFASDVHMFGCFLLELITGTVPYADFGAIGDIATFVMRGDRASISASAQPVMREIINDCWKISPESRPKMDEIVRRLGSALAVTCEIESKNQRRSTATAYDGKPDTDVFLNDDYVEITADTYSAVHSTNQSSNGGGIYY